MKKIVFPVFIFVGLVVFCHGQIDTTQIDKIVSGHIANNQFSGTVLIADQAQIIYNRSAGLADRESGREIDKHTHFGIASITKMLTAIVILQLEEEGKIALDNSLWALLPKLHIPNEKDITVHHLLLHISGLPNEKNKIYASPKSPNVFIKEVLKGKVSRPGKFNYANIDYVLLGLIIEKATGKAWEEAIRERILNPLGMEQSGFLKKGYFPQNFAYPYSINKKGEMKRDPDFFIENFYAAGNMYSTAEDLLKIDQAMYGEQLLTKESKAKMFKSYPEYNYTGYSVWTYQYPFLDNRPRIMERRGGILGTNVVLVRLLDTKRTIIILSNNDGFTPDSFGDEKNLREALIRAVGR